MSKPNKILTRAVVVIGGILLFLLAGWAIVSHLYSSPIEERIAAIRAKGEPVSIADLITSSPPAEEDSAAILHDVGEKIAAMHTALEPIFEANPRMQAAFAEPQQAFVTAVFEAHPEVWRAIETAANAQGYTPAIGDGSSSEAFMERQMERTQFMRQIARLLSLRIMLLNDDGRHEAALAGCVDFLKLCRQFDREPAMTSQLASYACRSMAAACANVVLREEGVSQEARRQLEAELTRHDMRRVLRETLISERAFSVQRFDEIIGRTAWFMQFWRQGGQLDFLKLAEGHLALLEKPYAERAQALGSLGQGLRPLASLLAPAWSALHEATARTQAKLRCLRILCAIQSQAAATGDSEPAHLSLAELGLPAETTTDPYTGDPLVLKRTDAGWLIYSLGADLRDGGGDFATDADVGLGPVVPLPVVAPRPEG